MSFVLDNSVALTWCFEDERTSATTALLIQVGNQVHWLPGWRWLLETLNGLPSGAGGSMHHGGIV